MRDRLPSRPSRRPNLLFFFDDTATTEIYTLSLHDALPIFEVGDLGFRVWKYLGAIAGMLICNDRRWRPGTSRDRKSTRLNSSHSQISYAVFCLKKKKTTKNSITPTSIIATFQSH